MEPLGKRLQQLRRSRKWSVEYLSELTDKVKLSGKVDEPGLSSDAIRKHESLARNFEERSVFVYASAFGIPIAELVRGTDHEVSYLPAELRSSSRLSQSVGTVHIMPRDDVNACCGDLETRIKNAKQKLWILGINHQRILDKAWFNDALEEFANRTTSFDFRLIFLDPTSEAPSQFAQYDKRWTVAEELRDDLRATFVRLSNIRRTERYGRFFDFRMLRFPPSISVFVVDSNGEDDEGIVNVEIYVAKDWEKPKPPGHRPVLLLQEMAGCWRKYFFDQFEKYWALGSAESLHPINPQQP